MFIKHPKLQFGIGLTLGFLLSVIFFQSGIVYRPRMRIPQTLITGHVIGISEMDTVEHGPHGGRINDSHVHHDDTSVADKMAQQVRVLCWVMTSPTNFRTKADVVKATWGHRCNILLFFSSVVDPHLPTIALNVSEGRQHLTAKSMHAFKYVYDHYYDQADWFMKCDDDTYVIVENLRYFLSTKNTSDPFFYGHHFKPIVKQGYYSGGAGYVLSKEALTRFAQRDPDICRKDGGSEDAEIGRCMETLGIRTGNSTDALGRSRFHCFPPEAHVNGGFPKWYYTYVMGGAKQGIENISDYAISFHYINPSYMLSLEFYVYHLRPYGIRTENQALN
ncbi:glycoprotein-N-acetylgalactosamine 3-beta-galactosyltransferase 1-B-like [Haliotis rubra]|uniref:glycoprotein-N-acetylgalactosamine 3-beta-galactosyltransferase 1-B-like n=1 Tax=Haliotis rubra TaxID=36100 RepID=UPI001EE55D65|nr:glycoprotein-N-acetylgalactosamine 3-beta-galactosyltransferase 1-B-like [Haliotis rubra]